MIYSNFTGRVAKKAKVIDGVNGQFLSMDLAVNDYSKGEEVTQWVRVQSSDPAHLKLAEYFTKGRILTIQGNVKIDQWEGKDGTPHAQLRVHAKFIDFLNIGKKQEGANVAANAATDSNFLMYPQTPRRRRRTTCLSNPLRGIPFKRRCNPLKESNNMKQVFVVYETDAWHTIANRDCKGIYTSKRSAINAIVKNHEIDLEEIFEDDRLERASRRVLEAEAKRIIRKELEMNYQTQGYSTNYDIEVWNVNDWG